VRYIGNKTRLLGFILATLKRRGIAAGDAIDPFTGTASVARALKRRGFRVTAADIMHYGYVFARAYVQTPVEPSFLALSDAVGRNGPKLRDVVAWLNRLPPRPGFVHRQFSPEGDAGARHGRMYFTPENAAHIDAVRDTLEAWRGDGSIDGDAYHVLLASLIEAADRVANTAGIYASFIKSWQPNALRPLRLQAPRLVLGNGCHAERAEATELVARQPRFDLLYLDPPYNGRQYPAYYHVPELLATGWYEAMPELRGKVGLAPDAGKRSDWARRGRCEAALEALLSAADGRHILMSYNSEGLIPQATIRRLLREWGRAGTFRLYPRGYRRYRADADGERRRYRGDVVEERLYCVSR
jgi:adenine-specific DNA-methyltransferase